VAQSLRTFRFCGVPKFVIVKSAKSLGLKIADSYLLPVDEVIE